METKTTLYSASGLARELRLPLVWLLAEADAGRVPCLRIGRRRFFNLEAVRHVLAERAGVGETAVPR